MTHPTPVAAIRQLAETLMDDFDPGGSLPEDCAEWALDHESRLQHVKTVLLEFAALREVQETATWQPIETAPFDTAILIVGRSGRVYTVAFPSGYPHDGSLTHWMPLPTPPRAGEGQSE